MAISTKAENLPINPQFDKAFSFADNGRTVVCVESKYGIIDKKGAYIVNPIYSTATKFFADNYAFTIDENETFNAIDTNGKVLASFSGYEFNSYSAIFSWES